MTSGQTCFDERPSLAAKNVDDFRLLLLRAAARDKVALDAAPYATVAAVGSFAAVAGCPDFRHSMRCHLWHSQKVDQIQAEMRMDSTAGRAATAATAAAASAASAAVAVIAVTVAFAAAFVALVALAASAAAVEAAEPNIVS